MLTKSICLTILNSAIFANIAVCLIEYFKLYGPSPTDIDKMPSVPVFVAQISFCMMIEDITFYFSHRMLHHPRVYPSVHKIHHENKVNYCLASVHTHPIEYMLGNILPMMLGPGILWHRIHRAAIFGWYVVRMFETSEAHSGYSIPFSPFRLLPFQLEADYHFFHHETNVGNYATFFTWWDTVFGTNALFYKSHKTSKIE